MNVMFVAELGANRGGFVAARATREKGFRRRLSALGMSKPFEVHAPGGFDFGEPEAQLGSPFGTLLVRFGQGKFV